MAFLASCACAWLLLSTAAASAPEPQSPLQASVEGNSSQPISNTSLKVWAGRVEDVVFIVKTGQDVYSSRMPNLQSTWLQHAKNVLVVSDHAADGVSDVIHANQQVAGKLKSPSEKGWASDRLKNLPAFKEAWEKWPRKSWYIMVDDDTYVSLENLAALLGRHDPTKRLYLGNNYIISGDGCDGLTIQDQRLFAHGGSGIFLSGAAAEALAAASSGCIDKYGGCWAGDGMLGICMHSLGIDPIRGEGLCGDSPFEFAEGSVPGHCATSAPVTYHHMKQLREFQTLYKLEHDSPMTFERLKGELHPRHLQHLVQLPAPDKLRISVLQGNSGLQLQLPREVIVLHNLTATQEAQVQAAAAPHFPYSHSDGHGCLLLSSLPFLSIMHAAQFEGGQAQAVELDARQPLTVVMAKDVADDAIATAAQNATQHSVLMLGGASSAWKMHGSDWKAGVLDAGDLQLTLVEQEPPTMAA